MNFQQLVFALTYLLSVVAIAQADADVVEAGESAKVTVQQEDLKSETKKEETKKNSSVEKIEVTGSYVRRIDIEGPSPVVTIDKEDFEVAGVDTVTDYMRENPMFSSTQDSGNRDGYFNFRGQHAGSTLVLINGIRVPKLGGADRGFYTGVENIPTNIIERVEVLKDGSSALYGSDAMAGVMNFITKKDYDGVEYSTRVNVPEIGEGLQQNHTLAFGKSYSRGNWFLSSQYVEQRGYTQMDAGNFFKEGVSTAQNASNKNFIAYSQQDDGGFKKVRDGSTFFQANCAQADQDDCPENDTRGQDFIRDPRENLGTLLTGRYDITNDISLSMVGIYNRRRRMDLGRPQFINFTQQNGYGLFRTADFTSNALQEQTQGHAFGELTIRPNEEVGNRNVEILQNSYSAQTKLEGYFLDSWNWNLSGSYAYSLEERYHSNGLVDMDKVSDIITNSSTYSFTGRNEGAFAPAGVQGTEAYEASMTTARLVTSGELFDMGGPVSMAVGVEGQWETTNDAHDAILIDTNLNVPFDTNQEGVRTVTSAFAEIVAYPLEQVEFQMAGRSDTYSDFGSTFNPKFSLGYRPSRKVLLRTSWGTNFNAPSVRNMIQRDFIDYQSIQACPPEVEDCRSRTVPVTRYRDPSLRPEQGVNYNFGTVIQPNKNWTFTFDQWNFEGEGMLARRSGRDYSALYDALGGDEQALADQAGVTLERDASGNIISARFPAVRNMGERIIRGIDFNIAFNSPLRLFGRVVRAGWKFDHTHMLERKTKYTEFSQFRNYSDMEWKNTTSVYLSTKDHSYRLAARTLAGDTGFRSQTRAQTMYDFNYSYQIPWWTAKVSLGVKNLLNSRPNVDQSQAFVDFTSGFNARQFQALGRRYYVGYSHTF